jgi:hypothetical protein
VIISVLVVFFVAFFNAYEGGTSVRQELVQNARLLGADQWHILKNIRLPFVMAWTLASLPLSVTFADYLMPTASEMPPVEVLLTEDAPSPNNALGMKGAGEAGITGVGAAIAAAIDDAIGIPNAITRLPVTPQRLRALLKQRAQASK